MTKHVITTVQTIVRKYFAEVDDRTWAEDGIVMGDMEEYCATHLSEDIVIVETVDEWPEVPHVDINGAVMKFDYENDCWITDVMWPKGK